MFERWSLLVGCLAVAVAMAGSPCGVAAESPAGPPLKLAHAHNDYLHARPLLDALDHGFTSVEADIFLVDGRLLIGHTRNEVKPDRTLQSLYLDPLRQRVRAGAGQVFEGRGPFTLLIDIKTAGEPTYALLAQVLASYADIISVVRDGQFEQKAVDVVISGSRPRAVLEAESVRYAGIDGRLDDLDSDLPPHLLPWISDNWALNFHWRGVGPLDAADRKKLETTVSKAHAHGRKIRYWATPDNATAWRELRATGVDLINTDDLPGLEKFLRSEPAQQ